VAAASSEAAALDELFQLQNDQGPCLDCYRTGQPVIAADLVGPGPLDPADLRIGKASPTWPPSPCCTNGTIAGQLQAGLTSRVIIKLAKSKLAVRHGTDMDEAFRLLRAHARDHSQRLTDTARYVIDNATADFPPPGHSQPAASRPR
jgi:hypothetical protein